MLGIIVANVPEGLLPTFTLALSMASLRMAKKQVLVKSLEAVEALGAVHVICTDKTGTLTRNELAIAAMVDPIHGEPLLDNTAIHSFLKAALIASQVRPRGAGGQSPTHWTGDPMDVAVAARYAELFGEPTEIIAETRRHFPFDLQKRREAGVYANGVEVRFAVKGAWESLRPLIGFVAAPPDRDPSPATAELLAAGDNIVHRISTRGQRVIAVAHRRLEKFPDPRAKEESLEQSLILDGFLALDDPIREEVPAAVAHCHNAGIRVLLITGDHPDTAEAIARQCGILSMDQSAEDHVLLGTELQTLRQQQLVQRLRGGEAADLVLLDDNFASIVAGVEEGRAVFANIQKFTTYVLASNVPEIVPFLLYVVFPVPLALTVIQILSIDLGTDLVPAIGLGQEPPERDVMKQPPRHPTVRLLSFPLMATSYLFLGIIQAAWSLFMFFGSPREHATAIRNF